MVWSLLQKAGSRGIAFVVLILLARLLTPRDFGLIGMLMIFIQISQTIVDGGFNLALIQKKDTDEEDYSSVFYINLVVSSVLYLIIFFGAPFIADFYNQAELTVLTRVLATVFIINAFSYVQEARLTKEMHFKKLMIIHIPSTIIGGVASVLMAFAGFGVWSLVAMQVITRLAYAIQIWIYARWKPLFSFNTVKAKGLFSFGGKLLISRVLTTIYNNIFTVIIGKFYPVSSVGYYQNAFNLANTPSATITNVLSKVTFPIFASIQDDDIRLKKGYQRVMQQAFFWICPMYVFAAVLAEPLFQLLFTSRWLPAVPYFQWLCIVAIFQPLNTYNLNIVNVKGRSDVFLRLQMIRRTVTIIAVIAVFPLGINALLIVQAASSVFTFLLFSHYAGRFIKYSLKEQVADILPIILLSVGVGTVAYLLDRNLSMPDLIRVVGGLSISCLLYYLLVKQFKLTAFEDIRESLGSRFGKAKRVKKETAPLGKPINNEA
jgi:O-antigen/teichoic acid export membrane protein